MKIAIVKLSALGDIVHAMIVLQFIKKFNNEIIIDWIIDERYKDLLENNPDINKVHLFNLKKAKEEKSLPIFLSNFKKALKIGSFDLVIDMQGLIKSAILSKLIPSKETLGFDKFSAKENLASFFYNKTFNYSYSSNVIERNIALLEFALGLKVEKKQILSKSPFLFHRGERLKFKITKSKKNIILIPGASHISKRYPISSLAELTKSIDANFYVIWGSYEEQTLALKIKEMSEKVKICPKLSINSLIHLISKVDLVIGPDTGPTHISWALNVPSITLFGPTPGNRNTYETSINRIIASSSKVNSKKINKNDYSIKNINVEEVLAMAKELLN